MNANTGSTYCLPTTSFNSVQFEYGIEWNGVTIIFRIYDESVVRCYDSGGGFAVFTLVILHLIIMGRKEITNNDIEKRSNNMVLGKENLMSYLT